MIAPRGLNIFELDHRATEQNAPYGIITTDCSEPKEIDDGLFVHPLDSATEAYRVGVCVADASKLYADGDIRQGAMERVHADYWDLPDGERGYDPMIPPDAIKDKELTEGNSRSALIISFLVGVGMPPCQASIDFGRVEVKRNYTYKSFSERTKSRKEFEKYSRASNFIINGLGFNQGGDSLKKTKSNQPTNKNSSYQAWKSGSAINESFMVAANHLVGMVMRDEDRPAIYRVHDMADMRFEEIIETNVARYSSEPGRHQGLNIDPYCRATSPLRRLEDFIMAHHLKLRSNGEQPSSSDIQTMNTAIRRLNRQAIYDSMHASQIRLGRTATQPTKRFAIVQPITEIAS